MLELQRKSRYKIYINAKLNSRYVRYVRGPWNKSRLIFVEGPGIDAQVSSDGPSRVTSDYRSRLSFVKVLDNLNVQDVHKILRRLSYVFIWVWHCFCTNYSR